MEAKMEFFRPMLNSHPKPVKCRRGQPGEVIFIPPELASCELSKYKISARLRGVLGFNNYWRLGDLDGVAYKDLLELRNCGKVSVAELKVLVKSLPHDP